MWNDLSAAAISWSFVALREIMIVLNVLFLMVALPSKTLMMSRVERKMMMMKKKKKDEDKKMNE